MTNKIKNIKFLPHVINSISNVITKKEILLSKDNQIIFLFGGQNNINNKSVRQIFYDYTQRHLIDYQFLLAEDFINVYNDKTIDLLTIEKNLASYTDCVIIILESPGTFAELGAFAMHDELAKKILVINDIHHQKLDSFINLGPIAKINNDSIFGSVIYSNFDSFLKSINSIEKRLKDKLRKKSKRVSLDKPEDFNNKENKKNKILLISDIISLFGPINNDEIIEILREIYNESHMFFRDIKFETGLLKSLGLIHSISYKESVYYMKAINKEFYFYNYSKLNIYKFRFEIINHYAKYQRFRLMLTKKIHEQGNK